LLGSIGVNASAGILERAGVRDRAIPWRFYHLQ
jgi:hypothetical protein